jgi:hypothetical protein
VSQLRVASAEKSEVCEGYRVGKKGDQIRSIAPWNNIIVAADAARFRVLLGVVDDDDVMASSLF